jgi:hypothetical protein
VGRTLREQMQADASAVFFNTDEFAQVASYVEAGSDPVEIHIVSEDLGAERKADKEGRSLERSLVADILRSELDRPAVHAAIVIDDESWTITGILGRDEMTTTVKLDRPGRLERSRPNAREDGRGRFSRRGE